MPTKPNDPAFTGPTDKGFTPGLTKLEFFAAMAMEGLLSGRQDRLYDFNEVTIQTYKKTSVRLAKGLINELNKEQ